MKKLSLLTVLIFFITVFANAQDNNAHGILVKIPSYSLVGLSSTDGITLSPGVPGTAGEGLDFGASSASDNSIWLNYSSILNDNSSSNSISVAMSGATLPAGVTIELAVAPRSGSGKGHLGTEVENPITLATESHDVVTDIKNGYTGSGANNGHQLTYTLKMDNTDENYSALTSDDYSVTITYTITDN